MPRVCTVCKHKKRDLIDRALVDGDAFRNIARRYKLSLAALVRHRDDHLPATLVKAKEAQAVANAGSLLDRLEELTRDARRIGQKAEDAKDYRAALAGVRELVRIIELLAELEGKLNRGAQIVVSPEWTAIRTAILKALDPHPEARQAVLEALSHASPGQ